MPRPTRGSSKPLIFLNKRVVSDQATSFRSPVTITGVSRLGNTFGHDYQFCIALRGVFAFCWARRCRMQEMNANPCPDGRLTKVSRRYFGLTRSSFDSPAAELEYTCIPTDSRVGTLSCRDRSGSSSIQSGLPPCIGFQRDQKRLRPATRLQFPDDVKQRLLPSNGRPNEKGLNSLLDFPGSRRKNNCVRAGPPQSDAHPEVCGAVRKPTCRPVESERCRPPKHRPGRPALRRGDDQPVAEVFKKGRAVGPGVVSDLIHVQQRKRRAIAGEIHFQGREGGADQLQRRFDFQNRAVILRRIKKPCTGAVADTETASAIFFSGEEPARFPRHRVA